jgi:hypothetical protein
MRDRIVVLIPFLLLACVTWGQQQPPAAIPSPVDSRICREWTCQTTP